MMSQTESIQHGDVAIIGMACRVAGADSPSKLWDVLATSKDVQSEMRRFNADGFYKKTGGPRKGLTNVRRAYFMDEDVERFDNAFFSISPNEASAMDPQQRLLLEVTYEAVENAGIPLDKFRGTSTGVYTGITWNDYAISLFRDLDMTPKYCSTGAATSISANRVSYCFDLHGPSMVIDTACSSTMVALHSAVTALNAGDASMAIVNGANVMLNPDTFIHMSELGFLSPSGRCRSFDAAGDGYVRAEGVLALLLKPAEQAIADGDPIRAVIKGTSINQDGKTDGITLPSSEAQRRNMEALYARKSIDPADVQYFEAHGTGTAAGDPLELSAIDAIFGPSHVDQKLIVGSVKSNIGHLEPCAALAGIVKTVECLEHALITPQMHFHNPNPKIDFSRIEVPTRVLQWPESRDGIRRASINSFGFGGTNGHAILQQGPEISGQHSVQECSQPLLFMVSAATEEQVRDLAASYADHIEACRPDILDLAHTLLARRTIHRKSAFIVAQTSSELCEKLRAPDNILPKNNGSLKRIAFIFTGQGAQWPSMGKELIEKSPLFRYYVKRCSTVLQELKDGPTWNALEELCKPKETSQVYQSSFSQPLCTVLQIALVELWRSFGISPVAVVGHSSGEIGAAYCSGMLSLKDAVTIAYYRGLYLGSGNTDAKKVKGAMCAVGASESQARKMIANYPGQVALAAVNSPSSCTLSGDESAILEICQICKEDGTFCRQLKVDMAYHSHHMLKSAPLYEKAMVVAGVKSNTPTLEDCSWFSSVYGRKLKETECMPSYWTENMVSTVKFTAALESLVADDSIDAIVELGPHPALKGPAQDTLASIGVADLPYFSSCMRGKPDYATLLLSAASMATSGAQVNLEQLNSIQDVSAAKITHRTGRVLSNMPKYPWDHRTSFTSETRTSKNFRQRLHARHELLGARKLNDNPLSLSWRNLLLLKEIPWLAKLKQDGLQYVPPSTYILMALQAVLEFVSDEHGEASGRRHCSFTNVNFPEQLPLNLFEREDTAIESHFDLRRASSNENYLFEVFVARSSDGKEWAKVCSGTVNVASPPIKHHNPVSFVHDPLLEDYIQSFQLPPHHAVEIFELNRANVSGRILTVPENEENHVIDPAGLSSLFRLGGLPMLYNDTPMDYCIERIESLEIDFDVQLDGSFLFASTSSPPAHGQNSASLEVFDENNACLIKAQGINFVATVLAERKPKLQSLFFRPVWQPDITHMDWTEDITIPRMVELMTHKYPGADIAIATTGPESQAALLRLVAGHKNSRPRFRSLTLLGKPNDLESERIHCVEEIEESAKFHLIFTDGENAKHYTSNLHPAGHICTAAPLEKHYTPEEEFNFLAKLTFEPSDNLWNLYRLARKPNGIATLPLRIIASEGADLSAFEAYDYEHVRIDSSGRLSGKTTPDSSASNMNVIVLDCGARSLLSDTTADDLLQWTRPFVENVKSLLWVSLQKQSDPYRGIAGSFVRTLVTEKPGLQGVSLIIRDAMAMSSAYSAATAVYDNMLHGETEIELVWEGGIIKSLRYVPDDELSASVGLHPPVPASSPNSRSQYDIVHLGKKAVEIYARPKPLPTLDDTSHVWVDVKASYVDFEDLCKVCGGQDISDKQLGTFFAGRVTSSANTTFPQRTRVLGWTAGSHKSFIDVPVSNLLELPENLDIATALSQYANLVTAESLVVYAGRSLPGDRAIAHVPTALRAAIEEVCRARGIILAPPSEAGLEADLSIEFDFARGWIVNGRTRSMRKLLSARRELFQFDDLTGVLSGEAPLTFTVKDYQKAFEAHATQPIPSVILFEGLQSIEAPLVSQRLPATMFRSDGAYVIIGGLGGLGRWLCEWLIYNGVKTILTMSRSGPTSAEAQKTATMIKELGATLLPFKVDATDAKAVSDCLAEVRQHTKICGCFNLAMILQDSPYATMTASQWDRALRVKIDSAWNLHMATQVDDLDCFIMFSSITSITGNRMQANYATGNAFLNAMAEYRHSLGLVGTAIALSSISGIGVLANDTTLLNYFAQVGHALVGPQELDKVMTAAIAEGRSAGRPLISLGMQMFECIDGVVQAGPNQNQLFWTEFPEFGFLLDHKRSGTGAMSDQTLAERLMSSAPDVAHAILQKEFIKCLASILGSDAASIDSLSPISAYGVDSLNAVACRYWLFKELNIDVPVFELLGCKSIKALIDRILARLHEAHKTEDADAPPEPKHHTGLTFRPASHSQKRLWFLHKFLQDKTVYNLLLVCHIEGTVQTELFKKAWTIFVERHEVLRSKLVDTAKGLQQIPVENVTFPIDEIESSGDKYEQTIKRITTQARSYVFNLEEGELVRGWLLKSEKGWRFFLASHHLAWDRSSSQTIFDETPQIYKALVDGSDGTSSMPDVPYQFIDYTLWQNACLEKPGYVEPLIKYWSSKLLDAPESVSLLPMAHVDKRPLVKRYSTDHARLVLGKELLSKLKEFCVQTAATPFMFIAASISGLVARMTGDEDIVIGITDGDRGHSAFDQLVGFTVNMLAIRSQPQPDIPFVDFLEQFRQSCFGAYEHRGMPFDHLLNALNIPRRTAHSPVFQITVNYQVAGSFPPADYGTFAFNKYDHYNARVQSDISLDVVESADGELLCDIEFDTDLYDQQGMQEFSRIFQTLLENILGSSGTEALGSIKLASKVDEDDMAQQLHRPLDLELVERCQQTFSEILAETVRLFPGREAIVDEQSSINYGTLDALSDKIAASLLKSGAKNGDAVGVFCEPSVDMLLAIYGIVKAGCYYVPLQDTPDDRVMSIMEDTGMQRVMIDGQNDKASRMATCGVEIGHIFVVSKELKREEIAESLRNKEDSRVLQLSRPIRPDDPFCCMFTSGTTGKPKGVFLRHNALRCWAEGYNSDIGTEVGDRFLLVSAIVFDVSLVSIYGSIMYGGTIVVPSQEARYSPRAMNEIAVKQCINNLILTPTQYASMLSASNKSVLRNWTSLKRLALIGEPISPHIVKDHFALGLPEATMWNSYGPAEAHLSVALGKLEAKHAADPIIPIHAPHFPARLYILDAALNPTAIGVPGELYIGGASVCTGYINRPEITKAAFVPDPFARETEVEAGYGTMYRTGDRFCLTREGTLLYQGRIAGDRQVKIRGMRTELSEIESAIWSLLQDIPDTQVSQVAVVFYKAEQVLAAYIVCSDEPSVEVSRELQELLRFGIQGLLPIHMRPSTYVFKEKLPRTVSGKTDYKTLSGWPAPTVAAAIESNDAAEEELLTPIQTRILNMWQEILQLDRRPSAAADFFNAGGHSLILIRVQEEILQAFGVELYLTDMFANPTAQGMERLILTHPAYDTSSSGRSPIGDGSETDLTETDEMSEDFIDWKQETAVPKDMDWFIQDKPAYPPRGIIVTGAATMNGAYFIYEILTQTDLEIFCIAVDSPDTAVACEKVLSNLRAYIDIAALPAGSLERITAYHGALSHPTLGLSTDDISHLDSVAQAIFHLESDVSLLKNYSSLRPGNLGALSFLIDLARGSSSKNAKALHYLSTWGVPHLQVWKGTSLNSSLRTTEQAMDHMTPPPSASLGYLKIRWVAERMLAHAAARGVPVSIFRATMTAPPPSSLQPLLRTDINRRIIEGALQTGILPDFGSDRGGGMSWITTTYLATALRTLGLRPEAASSSSEPQVWHVAPPFTNLNNANATGGHISYAALAELLADAGYDGTTLRPGSPEEYFSALRNGDGNMVMHAEALQGLWEAGWVPFAVDERETRKAVEGVAGKVSDVPADFKEWILTSVIGERGF